LVLLILLFGVIGFIVKTDCGFSKQPVASKQTPEKKSMSSQINSLIEKAHFKGNILIVAHGQPVYEQSYGYANAQKKIANDTATMFPIASLQKIMTGALIVKLVEQGKLSMTTTLAEFYPEITNSQSITIQELLNHTSGITMAELAPAVRLDDQQSQLDYVLTQLAVTPNKAFLYTNANYSLLAGIISQLYKRPYEQVLQEQLIDKLDLKQTYFWDQLPKDAVIPQSYTYEKQDYQADSNPPSEELFSSLIGAGNLYMSVADFYVFLQSLTDGRLFSQEEYQKLIQSQEEGYRAGLFYWDQMEFFEGNLGGYDTVVYGSQDNQTLVFLFANQRAADMQKLSEKIIGLL
jgi:CubicO group peptidase (beta-lactamase class C family)